MAYTPQPNGVAERKNRTIMNMVHSMPTCKQMPKTFWPEAVNWAVHILNRSRTLAVRNKTPKEAWSGIKLSVDHFRVFGCLSYVHVPDIKRTKLDGNSLKCVLLGVSEESKAYRLYDPLSNKIVISRDIIFNEDDCWPWTTIHTEAGDTLLDWGDMLDNNILDHTHDAQPINTTSGDLVAEVTQSPTSVDDAVEQHNSGENSTEEVNDPLEAQSSNLVER